MTLQGFYYMQTTISRLNWYNKALSYIGDYQCTTSADSTFNPVYTAAHSIMKLQAMRVFNARLNVNVQTLITPAPPLANGFFTYNLATATMLPQELFLVYDNVSKQTLSFSNLSSRKTDGALFLDNDGVSLRVGQAFLNRLNILPGNLEVLYSTRPNFELPITTNYTVVDEQIDCLALAAGAKLAMVLNGDAQLAQVLEGLSEALLTELKRTHSFSYQRSYFVS